MVQVTFRVRCQNTQPGEKVYVVGSGTKLGAWSPDSALMLSTGPQEFPTWSAAVTVPEGTLEYKFIVKRDDKKAPVRWEGVEGNRQLCVEGDSPLEVFATWGDTNEKVVAGSVEDVEGEGLYDPGEESDDSLQPPKGGYAYGGSSRPSAGGSSLDCLQLLKVPCELKGQMVICGEGEALGGWNPYMAPTLKHVGTSGDREVWALPGLLADLTPGMAFKFVCLGHNGIPRWEENRPNRFWTCEEASYLFDLPSPRKGKEDHDELEVVWGDNWLIDIDPLVFPGAIFHAFNWKFADVQRKANTIAALGFDAVQLSPAQRSVEGDQWWARYQPTKYEEIHGLGSEQDLRNCCKACEKAGLLVFGDLVFNHMQVVASCEEWRKAQQDDGLMEILQRRLSQKLGPTFNRDDFQWPWYPLEGDDWDGEQRMEGWGCGEWSELKGGAPKVVSVHNAHVAKLKSCGVSGFRFDAAKHMRPEHIANYVDKADVYAYGEVLSIDPSMQREYTEGVSLTTGEQFPTTDFLLGVWLRKFIEVGPHAVDFEHHEWVKHLYKTWQGELVVDEASLVPLSGWYWKTRSWNMHIFRKDQGAARRMPEMAAGGVLFGNGTLPLFSGAHLMSTGYFYSFKVDAVDDQHFPLDDLRDLSLAFGVSFLPGGHRLCKNTMYAYEIPGSILIGYGKHVVDSGEWFTHKAWDPKSLEPGDVVGLLVSPHGDLVVYVNGAQVLRVATSLTEGNRQEPHPRRKALGPRRSLFPLIDLHGRVTAITMLHGSAPNVSLLARNRCCEKNLNPLGFQGKKAFPIPGRSLPGLGKVVPDIDALPGYREI